MKYLFSLAFAIFVHCPTALALNSPGLYYYDEHWISEPGVRPASHGSSLVELPNGDFLSCWYSGSNELARDVKIYCSRFSQELKTWQEPKVAVDSQEKSNFSLLPNKTLGNTVLYLDAEGVLWLFYNAVTIGGWSGSQIVYKTSRDNGDTWSEKGTFLVKSFGNLVRNKPIWLDSRRFLLPAYHEFTSKQAYAIEIVVSQGKILSSKSYEVPGKNHLQPTIAVMYPDQQAPKVMGYLRNGNKGALLAAQWDQFRKKWSKPFATNLPNPDSAADAATAPDRRQMLVVYNDSTSVRTPLALGISDDGVNFRKIWEFESDPSGDYSYPTLLKTKNGDYFLSYTFSGRSAIKSVRFSEEWLKHQILLAPPLDTWQSNQASSPVETEPELSTAAQNDGSRGANLLFDQGDSVQNFLVFAQGLVAQYEIELPEYVQTAVKSLQSNSNMLELPPCRSQRDHYERFHGNRISLMEVANGIKSAKASTAVKGISVEELRKFDELWIQADQYLYELALNEKIKCDPNK